MAQAEGIVGKDAPEVLFVCVHNAGRSQMAAGLLKLRSQGRISVRSAGSTPADEINPNAVAALEELGIDMAEEFPKPLTDEAVRAADVVITMGCGDACPIYPGKRYEDWELDDPAGQDLENVRRIRDEIDQRVQALMADLLRDRNDPGRVDRLDPQLSARASSPGRDSRQRRCHARWSEPTSPAGSRRGRSSSQATPARKSAMPTGPTGGA